MVCDISPKCHFLRAAEGSGAVLGMQEEIFQGRADPGRVLCPPGHPQLLLPATTQGHCPRHFNCSANYALSWTFKVIWETKKKGKKESKGVADVQRQSSQGQDELGAIPQIQIYRSCHLNIFRIFAPLGASPCPAL